MSKSLFRFFATSVLCALIYIGVLFVFGRMDLDNGVSNFILYVSVTILNYILSKYWTFEDKSQILDSALKFIGLSLSGVILNSVFVWALSEVYTLPYFLSGTLFLLFWGVFSYSFQKYLIFNQR